jgi:NAD(P)-dependent dehydrogenase (short-subunit alcohol dehydrogenase family)
MLNLTNRIAIVTGAGGALGGQIAAIFLRAGARVALWDISRDAAEAKVRELKPGPDTTIALACDVTHTDQVQAALDATLQAFGTVDILVNGAGGSHPQATTSTELSFFDLPGDAMMKTMSLNYLSAVIPSQAVGRLFAEKKAGSIINISSIAGIRPLTKAISYSNAKAATDSFTRWLAVHMATEYSPRIRVNAIAPGFVLTKQNRFLLIDPETGALSQRGEDILRSVPAARFGEPEEIAGAALWLASDLASFVTGAVIPVDGGFTATSGV